LSGKLAKLLSGADLHRSGGCHGAAVVSVLSEFSNSRQRLLGD